MSLTNSWTSISPRVEAQARIDGRTLLCWVCMIIDHWTDFLNTTRLFLSSKYFKSTEQNELLQRLQGSGLLIMILSWVWYNLACFLLCTTRRKLFIISHLEERREESPHLPPRQALCNMIFQAFDDVILHFLHFTFSKLKNSRQH